MEHRSRSRQCAAGYLASTALRLCPIRHGHESFGHTLNPQMQSKAIPGPTRSEERRVGKECRYRRARKHEEMKFKVTDLLVLVASLWILATSILRELAKQRSRCQKIN